jgi:RNA polymerase sigma-70 factor (ECF subfamily)
MVRRWRTRGGNGIETPGDDPPLDLVSDIGKGTLDDLADEALIVHPDRHVAFAVLYERYTGPILTYCRIRIGNPHDAEDAAAQVFVNAFGTFPSDNLGTSRAWPFTIAHHTVVNHYRRQQVRGPARTLDDEHLRTIGAPSPSPETMAVQNDDVRVLREALSHVNDDQRHVIELRLSGLKGSEIAEVLGRSENAVKMLQFRAMKRLRDVLAAEQGTPGTDATHGKDYADAH